MVVRCLLHPELAPPYEIARVSLRDKKRGTLTHVVPLGLIIFLVIGLIFLGVDTTMGDIYKAGIPFLLCDATVLVLVMIFPQIALYLPGMIK